MRHFFLVAQVCLLLILARGAVLAKYPISDARGQAFTQKAAATALMTNVNDPATLSETSPEVGVVLTAVRYMKANRLSAFSGSVDSELGKPLESVFLLSGFDDCAGGLESVVPVDNPTPQGLRILGSAWDRKRRQSASVVTVNGIIAGLGAIGRWHSGVRATNPELSSNDSGFVAFVTEPPPGSIVKIYAILHGSPAAAC